MTAILIDQQRHRLVSLCREKSYLKAEDILILENLLANLQYFADLAGADVFIDVTGRNPKVAVVVAEAKPSTAPSLYHGSVVGEYAYRDNEPAVFQTFESQIPVRNVNGVSQEGVPICQTVNPIKNSKDEIIAVLIMERDNSFQVRQERTMEFLSQTTQKLADTLLNMASVGEVLPTLINDALFIVDAMNRFCYANRGAHDLLYGLTDGIDPVGLTVEELIARVQEMRPVFSSDSDAEEVHLRGQTVLVRSLPILDQTEVRGTVYLLRDITELRKKERQLITKSAVIKEIHHRVKNNLQTIAGLMRLQMGWAKNQETVDAFQESINRISCIALVHEILSRDTPEVIELRECIRRIVEILTDNMLPVEQKIKLNVSGDEVCIHSDQATSTAIVVNELVQNSLKYAFPGNPAGQMTINVECRDDKVRIVLRDNGKGFPEGFSLKNSANLGLEITQVLVTESLLGEISMYNDNGAVVEIEFPKWGGGNDAVSAHSSG